jgi:hypothetical protein
MPMNIELWNGSKYLLTFNDDFTQKTFGYFLKSEDTDTVLNIFKHFKTLVENQTDQRTKIVRSDNGKEYANYKFQEYLQENGIVYQTTVEYCQNKMVSLKEPVKALWREPGKCYWMQSWTRNTGQKLQELQYT